MCFFTYNNVSEFSPNKKFIKHRCLVEIFIFIESYIWILFLHAIYMLQTFDNVLRRFPPTRSGDYFNERFKLTYDSEKDLKCSIQSKT
jgi:hypothetical protein